MEVTHICCEYCGGKVEHKDKCSQCGAPLPKLSPFPSGILILRGISQAEFADVIGKWQEAYAKVKRVGGVMVLCLPPDASYHLVPHDFQLAWDDPGALGASEK